MNGPDQTTAVAENANPIQVGRASSRALSTNPASSEKEQLVNEARGDARPTKSNWDHWLIVCAFAVAMAWVESAVVFDLRTMVDRLQPYQENPLPLIGKLGPVELVREFATLVMLLTVGMLAGKTWRVRIGYSLVAFGVWDIFYYIFLKVMCGWPQSLLDWDILFLLPLPWWGPVLAPMLIALLMIIWGTLTTQFERAPTPFRSNMVSWIMNATGISLALYVFMTDSLRVADQGVEVVREVLPTSFNWPLFLIALVSMAAPVILAAISVSWAIRRPQPAFIGSI